MIIREEKTVPAHIEMVFVKRICDLCGKESPSVQGWSRETYTVSDVEIRLREGYSDGDGGSGTEIAVDICPTCFKEKLVPWLESQGAKVETKEWDY